MKLSPTSGQATQKSSLIMQTKVIKKAVLENIPSASGVEVVDGMIYIIGDDSKYLFKLKYNLELLEKIELFKSDSEYKIPKSEKPDLECMTVVTINNYKHLLIFGSGSTDKRNKVFLVKLPTKYNKNHFVQQFDLTEFYKLLQSNYEITGGESLNLEAAASDDHHLYLFNRANRKGRNSIMVIKLEEFIPYLCEGSQLVPFPFVKTYHLPQIGGVPAGFSGASVFGKRLYFTASAEDTDNAYLDGIVAGSHVGIFELGEFDYLRGGMNNLLPDEFQIGPINDNGQLYKGKIESISIFEEESSKETIAIAVTDNDAGDSELLMLSVNF
ncbi:MAG: hypothetical protein J7604_01225 [Sporocytophaga sp.]|nr:hypothetical protein [Sporocytophaga sp.]